jgi:hypothetical protein
MEIFADSRSLQKKKTKFCEHELSNWTYKTMKTWLILHGRKEEVDRATDEPHTEGAQGNNSAQKAK